MLFSKSKRHALKAYTVPDGECVYAIGDIHGSFEKLLSLLDKIKTDIANSKMDKVTIIFLGDLMDRGPQSSAVIDYLSHYEPDYADTVFLMGNHEETYLRALKGSTSALKSWFQFGGRECVRSYGVTNLGRILTDAEELVEDFTYAVPKHHVDFVKGFKTYHIIGDYLFVHAGIKPKVPINKQTNKDMRWIRSQFLTYTKPHPYRIVHGHSVTDTAEAHANRIGVDTGAYREGFPLTAVRLCGADVKFLMSESSQAPKP